MAYGLFGSMTAVSGERETLLRHLTDAAQGMADVAGCRMYIVSRDGNNPDAICVFEVWDDADAHAASLQLGFVQELIAKARPIIAGMGERFEFDPVAGKGLAG